MILIFFSIIFSQKIKKSTKVYNYIIIYGYKGIALKKRELHSISFLKSENHTHKYYTIIIQKLLYLSHMILAFDMKTEELRFNSIETTFTSYLFHSHY